MKRVIFILSALVLVIALTAVCFKILGISPLDLISSLFSSADLKQERTEAFYLSGRVLVKKPDKEDWDEAKQDMEIEDGDSIATSEDSSIELKFGQEQKNYMAVNNNTLVNIKGTITPENQDFSLEHHL